MDILNKQIVSLTGNDCSSALDTFENKYEGLNFLRRMLACPASLCRFVLSKFIFASV